MHEVVSSEKVKVAVAVDVEARPTLPTPAVVAAANALGATAVARSEARSAALVAALIAFFQIVK